MGGTSQTLAHVGFRLESRLGKKVLCCGVLCSGAGSGSLVGLWWDCCDYVVALGLVRFFVRFLWEVVLFCFVKDCGFLPDQGNATRSRGNDRDGSVYS